MTRFKVFFTLLVFLIVFSAAIKPALMPGKTSSLEIRGYVYQDDEKVDKAMVKLYQNNKIVQMAKTKKSKFQFILFRGNQYMVEIDKVGFISERIQISTMERTEFGGKYLYEFRVDLIKASKFKGVDISNLDFPTAIIKYNPDEGEYMHDEEYSKKVRADMRKLKLEAKSKK